MTLRACPRESEVMAQVLGGRWPDGCTGELREHVCGCRSCGELILVMQAFASAREASVRLANPAAAGVLWWRAQLRRRNAAVRQIARPILGAQIFALVVTIAIAAVFVISQARSGLRWLSWFKQTRQAPALHLEGLWSSALAMQPGGLMLLLLGLVGVAALGGFVLFSDRQRE